jgi:hypothetical protein
MHKLLSNRATQRFMAKPVQRVGCAGGGVGCSAACESESRSPLLQRAPAPQAPGCTYDVHYTNPRSVKCDGHGCGAKIVYDVTGVTASGADCPATLNGLVLSERIVTDHGCGPGGGVETGIGRLIAATAAEPHKGKFPIKCRDTYELCSQAADFPATGCTEVYKQDIFVGGKLADKRLITFRINKSKDKCTSTATRS